MYIYIKYIYIVHIPDYPSHPQRLKWSASGFIVLHGLIRNVKLGELEALCPSAQFPILPISFIKFPYGPYGPGPQKGATNMSHIFPSFSHDFPRSSPGASSRSHHSGRRHRTPEPHPPPRPNPARSGPQSPRRPRPSETLTVKNGTFHHEYHDLRWT
jgi:hypothetical protein